MEFLNRYYVPGTVLSTLTDSNSFHPYRNSWEAMTKAQRS